MATQAVSGRGVVWNFSAAIVGSTTKAASQVVDFELEVNADSIDVSSFDSSGWNEVLPGIKSWRGSYSGPYAATNTGGPGSAKSLLQNIYSPVVNYPLVFSLTTSATSPIYSGFTQPARITLSQETGGLCLYRVDFEGYGALTYSTA